MIQYNATCDIYRNGRAPPSSPDVATVKLQLMSRFEQASQSSFTAPLAAMAWTHIALMPKDTDIRGAYAGGLTASEQDSIYVPDQDGTRFKVSHVELIGRSTQNKQKKVYLDIYPTWPTDEL